MVEQMQYNRKRKEKKEAKLSFSPEQVGLGGPGGPVGDIAGAKNIYSETATSQEAALYRAQKGQGGDRRRLV